jgi:hypothetical protein
MGLSIRAYARHRGFSHVAVLRAIKTGRVTPEPDGTIDPAKANASWERSTDPGRKRPTTSGSKRENLRPVAEPSLGSVRETLREQGIPTGARVTFVEARTARDQLALRALNAQAREMRHGDLERDHATRWCFDWRAKSATPGSIDPHEWRR